MVNQLVVLRKEELRRFEKPKNKKSNLVVVKKVSFDQDRLLNQLSLVANDLILNIDKPLKTIEDVK